VLRSRNKVSRYPYAEVHKVGKADTDKEIQCYERCI